MKKYQILNKGGKPSNRIQFVDITMLSSSEEFSSFFGSEHVPPLNDRTISLIESFLAFSLDSDFESYSSSLISFFSQHFNQLFSINQESLNPNDEILYSRLILSLSYLRPFYISSDFLSSAEKCAFHCLKNFTGQIRQASFSFLCTHYCNHLKNPGEGLFSFIEWIHQYFIFCSKNVNEIDIKFFIVVTSSMKPLLSRVIDYPQPSIKHMAQQAQSQAQTQQPSQNAQNQQKPQINQQQIQQQMRKQQIRLNLEKIPDFLTPIIEIIKQGLFICTTQFFSTHNELVIIKSLRLIVKFLEIYVKPSPTVLENLLNIKRLIPDDVRYFHIHENYLFVAFYIPEIDKDVVSQSLLLLPFAAHCPLSSNKRIYFYLQSLKSFFSKIQKKTIENFKFVMGSIWPLFGSPKINVNSHITVCEVLYKMISTELLKSNPMLTTAILRELISCFDLLRIEFETSKEDHELELLNWIDVNNHLITLSYTLISMEANSQDESERTRMIHPTLRMPLYKQMTKHIVFVLDVIVYSAETKDKINELIISFAKFIAALTLNSINYFTENMILLLPKSSKQALLITLHQQLIAIIKKTKPIYYYYCFFEAILNHFEELFLPSPTIHLLRITILVFNKAFSEENTLQTNQERYYPRMCYNLYKFFLKGVLSRNYNTMELLMYIIQSTSKNSTTRLQPFIQNFKQSSFPIPNIIRYLCEDPRIEAQASSMAIFLYSFCDSTKTSPAEWYYYFIPAIESGLSPSYSIMPFYNFTASKFADQIPKFPKAFQYRLITSLALSSSKIKNADINPTLTLLSRIPKIAAEVSRSTNIGKVPHLFIKVDGIEIDLDIIKDTLTMLKKTSPQTITTNIEYLCEIFEAIIMQIDFQPAAASEAVDTIAENVCKDRVDFLRQISTDLIDQLHKVDANLEELNIGPNTNLDAYVIPKDENQESSEHQQQNENPSPSPESNPNASPNLQKIKFSYHWTTNVAVTENLDNKYKLLKALQIIFYFRVKHISITGNNFIKTGTGNANASSTSSRDLSGANTESEKELLETEDEKEKRYEDEILQIFLNLGNEANKTSFFESFFILIYSKVTSIFALKSIEIMAKNFDFTSVAHKLNAVVLHGAQLDYPTSKRIMNDSIFPLLRRTLMLTDNSCGMNYGNEFSQDKKIEIFKQYYNFCSHQSHNVSKLSLSGMRFFESLKIMSNEIAESRKRYMTKLTTFIKNDQRFYINFIFYKPFDDMPENLQLMNELMSFIEKATPILTKEAIKLVNAAPSIDQSNKQSYQSLNNFFNAKFSLKVMAYYLASLPPSPTTQTAWIQLLSILREHSYNSFYEYFLKQLTKRTPNPSMPPDCVAILDIIKQFTKTGAQSTSSQQGTPTGSAGNATPNLSTVNLSNAPILHDLELLRLMIISNGPNLKTKAESYMIDVLKLICTNQTLSQQCEQIGTKIIEILKCAIHVDFIKVVAYVFEATISLSMKYTPIHLPLGLISERYAAHLITLFYKHLCKAWNNNMFYILANMTADEENITFRKHVIEKLKVSTDAIKEYIKTPPDPTKQRNIIDIDFAINIFLSAGERITNSQSCTLEMFIDIIEIVKKLSDLLPKDNHFAIYKPSIFIPMIGMCLPNLSQIEEQSDFESINPINSSTTTNSNTGSTTTATSAASVFQQMLLKRRQINRELKKPYLKEMNQNLRDVSMMTNVLIPFFLSQPKLFLHYLFVKRFTDFIKLMYTTIEERNVIYDYIENMARHPDQIYSQLLCWQLIGNRLKCFPEDAAALYSREKPFHIGFKEFPISPFAPSYLLHYTATMIASMRNKKITENETDGNNIDNDDDIDDENDFVFVDDLADNRAILVESSMSAIAVHKKVCTLEQACSTIPRFFHIVRFLQHTKSHFNMPRYLDHLFDIISMIPNCSKPAHMAFRAFVPLDVGKDPRVTYFSTLFSWANLYSAGQQAEKNFLYYMPVVLKKFQEPPNARERIFEQLTYCTMILLEKLDIKFPQIGPRLPSAFEEIVPNLNVGKVYESCQKMIIRIKKKISEIPCQELTPMLRFLPSLFASMSKILLYNEPLFCPPPLLPNVVLKMSDSKDFRSLYQRAMVNCISVSGSQYSKFLIEELHKVLKKSFDNISDPLKTPFATICMWINEVTNGQKFFIFVSTYLEIFKPLEESQIVQEWLNMKQPINSNVEDYILKNIPLTDKLKKFVLFCPPMRPVYIKNAIQMRIEEEKEDENEEKSNIEINERYCLDALFNSCWKTQWQEIIESVRPYFFAKLILPKCMTTFVKFITPKQIMEQINIALVSIIDDKNMAKFAEYYSALYPKSILTECFATVYKLLDNKTPLPLQTPYQAMKYLESRNFYDDSLGVLKINFPEYMTAATFHQLSNYSTAKAHYLNTMSEHEESYFYGLTFLRACDINLSLTRVTIPFDKISGNEISLPFLQTYSSPNVFTSFFSPVFLPLLLRFSIIEGIHMARSALQQRQTSFNPTELINLASSIVLKTIDKQTANVSNFMWKNSLLSFLHNLNEASLQPMIQDVLRQNRNYFSCLLMKSGDTKGALKMFDMSLGHSIISSSGNSSSNNLSLSLSNDGLSSQQQQQQQQQQNLLQLRQQASLGLANGMNIVMSAAASVNSVANSNLNCFGSESLNKTFKITVDNFPRILHFATKKQFLSLPRLLQFRILKELRYPIILESLINAGTGTPTPNQIGGPQPSPSTSGNINAAVAALAQQQQQQQQQSHSSLASSLAGHHGPAAAGHHGPSHSQLAAAAAAIGSHGSATANSHTQSLVQILAVAAASAGANSGSQNNAQNSSVAALSRAINNSNHNNANNNNNTGNNGGNSNQPSTTLGGINNSFNQLNANIAYVLKNNNKLWVDTLVSILTTDSISIDQKQVFMRIQNELIENHGKSERANYLIALSLGLVRLEELYKPAFISTMLVKNIPEDLKGHWIKWLQLLIQYVKEPPHEFLFELYKYHPIWFMMFARTPKPDQHFIDFYKMIEKNNKERRQRCEFDLGFSCLRKFDAEFDSYIRTYQLRSILFQYMASPKPTTFPTSFIEPFDNDIEKVVDYCDNHPVVFTTKQKIPDFHTFIGFKFPTILYPISAVSFSADGENEACFKLTTVTGESRRFAVASQYIYRFQLRESLLMFGLSKIFDKHISLRTRSSFNFYPMSFPVYKFILIAHYPLVSLQKIAHDNHIAIRLYKSYTKITETQNEGPFSQRERKQTDLPVDTFLKAYAKFAKGSLIDFLFARQSFASHLALACALRFLFNFPLLSAIPGMMISGDGQRVVIPDFFSPRTSFSQIPITRGIRNALPDYIMHGSFTTTWMDVFDALQKNSETFRVYLKVLCPDEQKPIPKIDHILRRLEKASTHAQEETNCFGPPYPVMLINNLIDCSVNAFEAQFTGFSWI